MDIRHWSQSEQTSGPLCRSYSSDSGRISSSLVGDSYAAIPVSIYITHHHIKTVSWQNLVTA